MVTWKQAEEIAEIHRKKEAIMKDQTRVDKVTQFIDKCWEENVELNPIPVEVHLPNNGKLTGRIIVLDMRPMDLMNLMNRYRETLNTKLAQEWNELSKYPKPTEQ